MNKKLFKITSRIKLKLRLRLDKYKLSIFERVET